MQVAVVADIHGNVLALDAVAADIARRRPDLVINLGDCVSGPLWPAETAERLRSLGWPCVRGNHDRQIATVPRALMGASDAFAFDRLTATDREHFATLPETLVLQSGILAFHGTPTNDSLYLLEDVAGGRLMPSGGTAIRERLAGMRAPVLLCGHSHQPRVVMGDGGMLIVNPGSVGCPAYIDHDPPHVSEAGSPHARYAMLTERDGVWTVELIALVYDWRVAARQACKAGRAEWARALGTGFVRGA